MKKELFLIIALLTSVAANGQTYNGKALQFYYGGLHSYYLKDYPWALIEFTNAIKLDSGFLQAWENRGVVKFYLKDFTGAISDYNKALEINPDDYNTFGRRAWAKSDLQDLNGAIADFTKAIEGNVNDADFRIGRGEAEFRLKDYTSATSDFDKVLLFGYGNREQRQKAFFWRGLIKIESGQRTDGCLDLKKSKKLGYDKAFAVSEIYCR
jgi:tetratricopeptide (TPR) repeat protein